jgi:hypothetical protein
MGKLAVVIASLHAAPETGASLRYAAFGRMDARSLPISRFLARRS